MTYNKDNWCMRIILIIGEIYFIISLLGNIIDGYAPGIIVSSIIVIFLFLMLKYKYPKTKIKKTRKYPKNYIVHNTYHKYPHYKCKMKVGEFR